VNEVFTVKQRYPRKILKGAVDQIIIVTNTAYTGVGMESRDNRILITFLRMAET
jgi:hypothetical protein